MKALQALAEEEVDDEVRRAKVRPVQQQGEQVGLEVGGQPGGQVLSRTLTFMPEKHLVRLIVYGDVHKSKS